MSYSKQIKSLDNGNVQSSLRLLLGQLNLVQEETERALEAIRKRVADIESRLKEAEKSVAGVESRLETLEEGQQA